MYATNAGQHELVKNPFSLSSLASLCATISAPSAASITVSKPNSSIPVITCPNFVGHVKFSDVKDLVKSLEEPMNNSKVTPSKYWSDDPTLRSIMDNWNIDDVELIPMQDYDTTDTQKVLNEIVIK